MNDEKNRNEEEEEELEYITVYDDDGREHVFELFTVLEVNGKEYAVLYPVDEDEDDEDEDEAIILRIETDEDGEETLVDIEDEEEWNLVAAAWEALIENEDDDKP
ncbi:MAG: DUF1292 domain-containing protein [Symbiobacteriaceae bacterium]|nr:DUF1292 domain-containing protein [Symbiobacteriaceae bacterium]